MLRFSAWLIHELVSDGTLPEDTDAGKVIEIDELLETTELDEADIENLRAQYKEYCEDRGAEPDFDI